MKFIDVKNDVAFRKIFGNENRKEVLISFLNAVLMLENDQKIVSVDILSPFQFPDLNTGKVSILDVRAIDQRKNNYLIEMQVAKAEGLHKRVLYYASKSYSSQIDKGELYPKLNPVLFIGILDFTATQNEGYISRHKTVDMETGEHLIKDMEFHFIELPKFNKELSELTGIIEQWVYFIKNAENLEVIPEGVTDEGLKIAYNGAEQHNWTKAELEAYDKVSMREQDDRGKITNAYKEGHEAMEEKARKREAELTEKARLREEELTEKARLREEELTEKAKLREEELTEKAKLREEELTEKAKLREEELTEKAKLREEELTEKIRQEKEEMAKEFRRKEEEMAEKDRRKEEENAERNLNAADIFLNLGVSIEATAKATGLTIEEVTKLKGKK